jgi:hypothetical protein
LSSVFRGSFAVQIARTIAYFVVGLMAIIAVGLSIGGMAALISSLKKRSRRKLVRYFAKADSTEKEAKRQVLLEIFVENGVPGLKRARAILKDERSLKRILRVTNDHTRMRAKTPSSYSGAEREAMLMDQFGLHDPVIAPLIREGLVRLEGNSVHVASDVSEMLSSLIAQLSEEADDSIDSPASPD